MNIIYIDNCAKTPVLPEVTERMQDIICQYNGNPSLLNRLGIESEKLFRDSRTEVAKVIGATPDEIVFTGSGTEANNMAILGSAKQYQDRGKHIVTTAIEHDCVIESMQQLEREGFEITYLKPDSTGMVTVKQVANATQNDTVLISVMYVNHETGAVQPVKQIGEFLKHRPNTLFHIDAVQAYGKMDIDVNQLNVDLLAVSGHKMYAPKGVGALFIRRQRAIQPLLIGDGLEGGLHLGTENVPGIVGIGLTANIVAQKIGDFNRRMRELRDRLWFGILQGIPKVSLHTPLGNDSAPHILYVSFLNIQAEAMLYALETDGIFVSTGSACSSKDLKKSYVLQAMGRNEAEIDTAIRFSVSPFLSEGEIDYTVDRLRYHAQKLRMLKQS